MSKTNWMLIAMLAVGMTGCAKPKTSGFTVGADVDEYGDVQSVLQVDNAKVARMLQVERVNVAETGEGLMRVNVRLASRLNKTFTAQSKFAWFDAEGMEIDPEGDPWRPLVLQGKETKTVQGVAPNDKAASFRLRVREGDRTRWIIH